VAYSILRRSTFDGVERWVEEAREYAGPVAPTIVVVGCKLDLVDIGCKRQVSYNEGKELAESLGALFIETSAKHGVAVEEAFKVLCEGILERMDNGEIEMQENMERIKLGRQARSGSLFSRKDFNVKRKSCCF